MSVRTRSSGTSVVRTVRLTRRQYRDALARIRENLADVYTARGISIWMRARQAQWGGRDAHQMVAEGNEAVVQHAVDQLAGGPRTTR